ncbi:hypothetical protein FHG87_007340 [Trinorchestia longiramus]|nr:hypothetical protein FHG87_007340 [Trinorchestia longiramus]
MVWAAMTATGRSSLIFVPCGVKRHVVNLRTNIFSRFSTITWLQRNLNLDSEKHSIFHKQRCMASKEPRSQSHGLFYLVHSGDKGLSYPSHFSRVPQSKTAKEIGSNTTRTDTCCLQCICK